MRLSIELVPEQPVAELIDTIELADDLGFAVCFAVDETYHKDMWQILAAAAGRTRQIHLSPGVTHVVLKDPTIIAHELATLDELSGGRAEAAFSLGNLAMLEQYHVDWRAGSPLRRLREAHHVMRTMLDEGRHRLRGRDLPVHGPLHGSQAGAGASPNQARRHARSEVVRACGRDQRRRVHGLCLLARARCNSSWITCGSARSELDETGGLSTSARRSPVRCPSTARRRRKRHGSRPRSTFRRCPGS